MRLALAAAVLALAAAATAPALAAEARTSLPDVEDEVMCVTCRVPLNVAESPPADAQRNEIRRLIAQGLTKDEVKDQLVAQYGEDVLALPGDDGVGIAAYAVPLALVAGLVAIGALLLPRWRRRGRAPRAAAAGPAASDAELKRLDEDLARYE